MEELVTTKLVHGGQALGQLADGRKAFVWGALPGERVRVRIIKNKRTYAEAIAEELLVRSPERVEPREQNYLATSPWQIMHPSAEDDHKLQIVRDLMVQFGVVAEQDTNQIVAEQGGGALTDETAYRYRNKMEYSFWGDDDGLHLALHQRGSKGKQIVQGSMLAMPSIDAAANAVLAELRRLEIRAGDLKTVIVRSNQAGETVAALFVKPSEFPRLKLPSQVKNADSDSNNRFGLKGLRVYHSNPKSPASVPTKRLYEIGDCRLVDRLLGREFHYDVDSFFQVNLAVYERTLVQIRALCEGDPVDMYAGVGSIGLSVAEESVDLIELDPATAAMARVNLTASGLSGVVTEASTENALEYITGARSVIFDPPRAGLHQKVVERCREAVPPQILYLSCNPATQARDIQLLQDRYRLERLEVYNFFPRTPHIETLAVLRSKGYN